MRAGEAERPWGAVRCRGVWIFRGLEIPAIMLDECYDMELYDFVKADINDPVSPPPHCLASLLCQKDPPVPEV